MAKKIAPAPAPVKASRKPKAIDIKALKSDIKEAKAVLKPLSAAAKVACKEEEKAFKVVEKLQAKLEAATAE